MVDQKNGCPINQLSQQTQVKVTYDIPTDLINQFIEDHFNRSLNTQSRSSSSEFIRNLGNSLGVIQTVQPDNSHQREYPKPLFTDSNQQCSSPQLFSLQKNKAMPEMVQLPIKAVKQRCLELEEVTQECKIKKKALSGSSKPLPATPVDELLSDIVTPNSEQPNNKLNCPYLGCDKVFKRSDGLSKHIRVHTGVKNFICNEAGCGRAFARSDHLLNHARSHKGIKQYKCEFSGCNMAFVRGDQLKHHSKTHTKQTSNLT